MHGAREVRKALVDDPRAAGIQSIVVWIPMLDSDDRAAAEAMTSRFADKPIPQFWDGDRALGREVSRSLGVDASRPAWDIYLFYPPGAEWTDVLPPATKVLAQSGGGVIGAKGTLPPKGDQSAVPTWARGRADVVGEPAELDALLSQIVVTFPSDRAAAPAPP